MSENVVKMENIKEGLLVVYIHGYGKNKTEYIGEFKGYEGNKVRIGRWEFKDQVVMKDRLLGVFDNPKEGVELGVDKMVGQAIFFLTNPIPCGTIPIEIWRTFKVGWLVVKFSIVSTRIQVGSLF